MKRCIICGHIGTDGSDTCDVCGNPYVDTAENAPEETVETIELVMEPPVKEEEKRILKGLDFEAEPEGKEGPIPEEALREEALVSEEALREEALVSEEAPREEVPIPQEALKEETLIPENGPEAKEARASEKKQGTPEGPVHENGPEVKEEPKRHENGEAVPKPLNNEAEEAEIVLGLREQVRMAEEQNGAQSQAASPRTRRMKSGPQIYGQSGANPEAYGQQGMIRRSVQGKQSGNMQGRSANAGSGTVSGRPVNAGSGTVSGRPVNAGSGTVSGRPVNANQENMSGRPVNANQGNMSGRPVNTNQGNMSGRPMNAGARPINPMQGKMAGRSINAFGNQSRQIMEAARAALKSPVFILIALLNTVYLVSSIAAIFMNQLNYSQVVRLLRNIELPAQVSGYMDTVLSLLGSLDSGHIAVNIVLNIPNLLFCIGLWLVVVTVRSAKENMSGVGFGFMKAVVIINLVKACIVMAAILVVTVAIVIAAWVSGAQSMIIASAISLVAVIVIVMMVIMYYFCYLATLKTCRKNANNGESYGSVSGYVAVVHIILALTACINLLSGIVNAEITGITGAVGKLGWMILFGIWIFLYRGKLSEYED